MDYFQDILFFLAVFTIYSPQDVCSGKEKMKICSFAGHATLYDSEEIIKLKLKREIINLIELKRNELKLGVK